MRREPNQINAFAAVSLAHELADIHHPVSRHIRVSGIADVRVMLPYDRLRVRTVVAHDALQGIGHVPIADIPRLWTAAHHGTVVGLRVPHDQRVLFRREERLLSINVSLRSLRSQLGE